MLAHDRHRLLACIDSDGDAYVLLGQAPFLRLPVVLGEVGIVDVRLVGPDTAPEHDTH